MASKTKTFYTLVDTLHVRSLPGSSFDSVGQIVGRGTPIDVLWGWDAPNKEVSPLGSNFLSDPKFKTNHTWVWWPDGNGWVCAQKKADGFSKTSDEVYLSETKPKVEPKKPKKPSTPEDPKPPTTNETTPDDVVAKKDGGNARLLGFGLIGFALYRWWKSR